MQLSLLQQGLLKQQSVLVATDLRGGGAGIEKVSNPLWICTVSVRLTSIFKWFIFCLQFLGALVL